MGGGGGGLKDSTKYVQCERNRADPITEWEECLGTRWLSAIFITI